MTTITNFIVKNNLYLLSVLGAIVGIYTILNWSMMPVLQRMVGLFFVAIVLHEWEEEKFPGGFLEMMSSKLSDKPRNQQYGGSIVSLYILFITLPALFIPNVPFLAIAPMILGIFEVIVHFAGIKIFKLKHFYTPGLFTALVFMLPISVYTIVYAWQNNLMQPISWLFSILYMAIGFLIMQMSVARMSGIKYTDFIKNIRKKNN